MRVVRSLIQGDTETADGLGYDLDLEHLGLIAWGPDPRAAVELLAAELDRRLLWVATEDHLVLAWLGSGSQTGRAALNTIARWRPPGPSSVAIGNPAAGLEGFRQTHREAGEAHVVAQRRGERLALYQDVALEALALRDIGKAREFVATQLDGLGQELRETLRAYFKAAQNATSAAAALDVRDGTVTRRVKKVEAIIGSSVNSKRAELELALRLDRLL